MHKMPEVKMSKAFNKGQRLDLSNAVSVRNVEIDSISTIRKLQHDSYMRLYAQHATDFETAAFKELLESSKYADDLHQTISKRQVYAAYLDHRMVGIAAWSDYPDYQASGRLRFLFVDPFFARCGVGATLLGSLEVIVTSVHCRDFSVRTVVPSMGFFEKSSYCTTSYGALPVGNHESFEIAFMSKSEFSEHKIISTLKH
ncbi:MAG TPA: hypothetical protein TECP_01038 [Hyphomicrobiaceae bacterium MAG_BT-2024]